MTDAADLGVPFVFEEGRVDFGYPVGTNAFEESGESTQVVIVGRIQEQYLVAVPQQAWHKLKKYRILPSLSKATAADVVPVRLETRQEPLEDTGLRIWLGFLPAQFVDAIQFETPVEEQVASVMFQRLLEDDSILLPYAQSLADLAQEHFAFVSA